MTSRPYLATTWEKVVDNRGLGTLRPHLLEVGAAHVHDDRLKPGTAFGPQQREERPQRGRSRPRRTQRTRLVGTSTTTVA